MRKKKFFITLAVSLLSFTTSWAQKNEVWEKTLSTFSRITQLLCISKVEFCDTATVLTFHLNFPAGQQIGFSSETMLQADGKDYKVKVRLFLLSNAMHTGFICKLRK